MAVTATLNEEKAKSSALEEEPAPEPEPEPEVEAEQELEQENAIHLAQVTASEELVALTAALNEEKAKSSALEEENKALRGQVATVLSYLDQVMPMEGGGDAAAAAAAAQ